MKKRNSIFILLLATLFIVTTVSISTAARKTDKTFSERKCTRLKGEVTDKYYGKTHNGKICLFKLAPDRGATLCDKNWKKCKWNPKASSPSRINDHRTGGKKKQDIVFDRAGGKKKQDKEFSRASGDKRKDKEFSEQKCKSLGGKATKGTSRGKFGKLCIYPETSYAFPVTSITPGKTLCNLQWKACEYHPQVATRKRSRTPDELAEAEARNPGLKRPPVLNPDEDCITTVDKRVPGPHTTTRSAGCPPPDRTLAEAEDCASGPNQVAFFTDAFHHVNGKGKCSVRSVGSYPTAALVGIPDNSVKSIRVGSQVQAHICTNNSFGGKCVTYKRDVKLNFGKVKSNTLSSAKVQVRVNLASDCNPGPDQVALFKDRNWVGPCTVVGMGQYANSSAMGIANNSISSILVGSRVALKAYEDSYFKGRNKIFDSSEPYFPTMGGENILDELLGDFDWHNEISSAKVIRR
jgi:hypothetical protein